MAKKKFFWVKNERREWFMENEFLSRMHNDNNYLQQLLKQASQIDDFQNVAEVFKQFCDTTRLRIFWLLCHCEQCVNDIADALDMTDPAISHHLRTLKNCKLIVSSREGKKVYYKAANSELAQLMHKMIEEVMVISCPK